MRDLLDLAEPLAMQSFDRARPLWAARAAWTSPGSPHEHAYS